MKSHLHKHNPHPCQPYSHAVGSFPKRNWLLLPLAALTIAMAACSGGGSYSEPSPVPVTDTRPVGEGLNVIGYAMLGAAVVGVLGRLLR